MEFLLNQISIIFNISIKIIYFFIMFCSPFIFYIFYKIILIYIIFIVGIPLKRIFLYFFPSLKQTTREKITKIFMYYGSKGFFMTFCLFIDGFYLLPTKAMQSFKEVKKTTKNYIFLFLFLLLGLFIFGFTKVTFFVFLFLFSMCGIFFCVLYVNLHFMHFLMKIKNLYMNLFMIKILFLFIYLFFLLKTLFGNHFIHNLTENCCIKMKKEIIVVIDEIKLDYIVFFMWATQPHKYIAYKMMNNPFYMWLGYQAINVFCYRYSILLAGGGSFIILPEKEPVAVETINLQTPYMQKFGKTQLPVVPYAIVEAIPEKPPTNLDEFIEVVANDPVGIRSHPQEDLYALQFQRFLAAHPKFRETYPNAWEEFVSGARWYILESTKSGKITALPIAIQEKEPIDFVTTEALYQIKTKGNISSGEIEIYSKKYENCLEEGAIIFISYDTLDKGQTMEEFSKNVEMEPRHEQQIVLHQRHMMPLATPEKIKHIELWHEKYPRYLPECRKIIKGEGVLKCLPLLETYAKKLIKK